MNRRQAIEKYVLRILSQQLRVSIEDQLVQGLRQTCGNTCAAALASLRGLRQRNLLCSQTIPVALPLLVEPVATWRPGRPAPDFNAVAWTVAKRLANTRPTRQRVYWAGAKTTRRVGGVGGRLRKPLQIEHDLGVAAIYFARQKSDPTTAARWQGEDAYGLLRRPTRGHKKPDAVLLASDVQNEGCIEIVLDYLSLYPPARLRDFHRYWSARNTRYEWW